MNARPTLEFTLLLLVFIALTAIPVLPTQPVGQTSSSESEHAPMLLQRLETIDRQAGELVRQAEIYLDNPPREYDLYFRDAVIVDAFLRQSMESITNSVNSLGRVVEADHGSGDEEVGKLENAWASFRSGLEEQLGVDPEMPRLEWGYEHIAERIPDFRRTIDSTAESIEQRLQDDARNPELQITSLIPFLAALVLALLALARYRVYATK